MTDHQETITFHGEGGLAADPINIGLRATFVGASDWAAFAALRDASARSEFTGQGDFAADIGLRTTISARFDGISDLSVDSHYRRFVSARYVGTSTLRARTQAIHQITSLAGESSLQAYLISISLADQVILPGQSVLGTFPFGRYYIRTEFAGAGDLFLGGLAIGNATLAGEGGLSVRGLRVIYYSAPPITAKRAQIDEIHEIAERLVEKLLIFNHRIGTEGAELRRAVGDLLANIETALGNGTLSDYLLECFTMAKDSGISLYNLDVVLTQLMDEEPTNDAPLAFVQTAIIYALAQYCKIISEMTFRSYEDVQAMMARTRKWFDAARDLASDEEDNNSFAVLTELGAKLARFLADTARPLPRMVQYDLSPLPSLALANRIYGDGSRAEEVAAENHVIHPGFCPPQGRVLSA